MIVYVPKSPDGELQWMQLSDNPQDAKKFMGWNLSNGDALKKKGWRIVRCELTEIAD